MNKIKFLLVLCLALALCLGAGCGRKAEVDESELFLPEIITLTTVTEPSAHDWSVGDTVELFGYSWTAIDVEEDNTLLICNLILPDRAFDTGLIDSAVDYTKFDYKTDWATSSIRAYLNSTDEGGFLYGADTSLLMYQTTYTERNSVMGLGEGSTNELADRVFLLSETEYKDYKDTIAAVDKQTGLTLRDYWLRTSGGTPENVAVVKANGELNMYGYRADFAVAGVRPCIRIAATNTVDSGVVAISSSLKVGQLIELGTYEQDGNDDTTDVLNWRVIGLSLDGSQALIITDQVIDAHIYEPLPSSNTLPTTGYADSSVHSWLNGDFLTALGEDAAIIAEKEISTSKNPSYLTGGGAAVTAKIFLPSIAEYNSYLAGKSYVTATATESAKENGASVDRQYGTSGYWLRNPGQDESKAMYVYYYGDVCNEGALKITQYMGVRPCAWINIAE